MIIHPELRSLVLEFPAFLMMLDTVQNAHDVERKEINGDILKQWYGSIYCQSMGTTYTIQIFLLWGSGRITEAVQIRESGLIYAFKYFFVPWRNLSWFQTLAEFLEHCKVKGDDISGISHIVVYDRGPAHAHQPLLTFYSLPPAEKSMVDLLAEHKAKKMGESQEEVPVLNEVDV